MTYSSSLANERRPLILDTSVLINLHACTYGERILAAIPNEVIVSQVVANELDHETCHRNGENNFLHGLVSSEKVVLADMSDTEHELFSNLVSGSPSLDDGEAATIAIAATRQFLCIVDEKRGRARARTLMRNQEPGWSFDLLRHPEVIAALGAASAIDALYLALRDGRMRIDKDHCDHVIGLIGAHRALDCSSLPGYRTLRPELVKAVSHECTITA